MSQTDTKGEQMMLSLREKLGIDQFDDCPKRKKVKTINVTGVDKFDSKIDGFRMTTHMVKLICQLSDCFKDNVVANIKFNSTGITIFALYHCKTVCINTHIGADLFTEIFCDKDVHIALNLMVLTKKISLLQKFKVPNITFHNEEDDLMISGERNGSPANVRLKGLVYEPEELDISEFEYNVPIRLKSSEFAKLIDCMPAVFSISLQIEKKVILFTGDDDSSVTKLQLKLDDDVIIPLKTFPEVCQYHSFFVKQNLMAIVKGAKLSEYVIVGLSKNAPLFVSYTLNESSKLDVSDRSKVNMYFSPKFCEDIEYE